MCGLVGRIAPTPSARLGSALELLRDRGPDAEGRMHVPVAHLVASLGHRRLSIVDLSDAANQPFWSPDGSVAMLFNGEIYNHALLRRSAAMGDWPFRTHSDTEILLALYGTEGVSGFDRLNGMFAVAILDVRARRLVLARDALGIKPLYFTRDSESLSFASDTHALMAVAERPRKFDPGCAAEFLMNGFLHEPRSGILGAEKVPPGTVLSFDLRAGKAFESHETRIGSPIAPLESFSTLLTEQVQLELLADVPVGVFFSGGIDSTAVLAAAPRGTEAFFLDYGAERATELAAARGIAAALGAPLRVLSCAAESPSAVDTQAEFELVARGTDEPISDFTFLATRQLARLARDAGFKVMLSGMGADELFAGYPRYAVLPARRHRRLSRLLATLSEPLLNITPTYAKRAHRFSEFVRAPTFAQAYSALVGYFSSSEVVELLGDDRDVTASLQRLEKILERVAGVSLLRQALWLDRFGFLAHNLTVTDRASMAESLEVRVPLLGPGLSNYAAHSADHDLRAGRTGKLPLRRFLAARIPEQLLNRPKVGFNPPLDARVRTLGAQRIRELIDLARPHIPISATIVDRMLSEHFAGKRNHSYRLWQLMYFALWLDSFAHTR